MDEESPMTTHPIGTVGLELAELSEATRKRLAAILFALGSAGFFGAWRMRSARAVA